MPKENISATVDPEVAEYLSKETVNASGVVNRAVKREMGILEEGDEDLLKLRLEQIQDERQDLEERAERKESMENRLKKRLNKSEQKERTKRQEVVERCVENWRHLPERDSPAIETQADKAGMEPDAFYEALTEAWGESDA